MTAQIVVNAIQQLESINPNDEFAYEEAIIKFLSIGKIPVLMDIIEANTAICRTRTHYKNELYFEKVSDIFIVPQQLVTTFSRCNKPYQAKFYGSENRPTSYLELVNNWLENFKEGDKLFVTIGEWLTLRNLCLVLITTPDKQLRNSAFDKHYGNHLDNYLGQYKDCEKNGFIEFYRYLFTKFRKDAKNDLHTYLITSAYCNLALSLAKGKADGIFYPSVPGVPAKENGMNFALNSNIMTFSNFKLSTVIRNEMTVIKDCNETNYKQTGLLKASSFDTFKNEIKW